MLKKIITQTGWSTLGSAFGFVIGFFVKMYLVRKVGVTAFGQYMIGQIVLNTIQVFVALSLSLVLIKFIPKYLHQGKLKLANDVLNFSIWYAVIVGTVIALIVLFFSKEIAFLFKENSSIIVQIIAVNIFYLPFILYKEYLVSGYRSLLKIKEIVLYGTIIMISIRAILTFIVFYYTNNILYFLYIEIISFIISDLLLTFKFKNEKLKLFSKVNFNFLTDKDLISFWKKMYFYALISFFGSYIINWIIGIYLPAKDLGVYSILVTISGVSAFLLINLNSVFAPIISSLYTAKNFLKLKKLYQDATFFISIFTFPFIIILVIFSKFILKMYSDELIHYVFYFIILIFGQLINIFVGNTGTILLMGGGENQEIIIKILRIILTVLLSVFLIPVFGLLGAVIVNSLILILMNLIQVFYVNKIFGFLPWNKYSLNLFTLTLFLVFLFGIKFQVDNVYFAIVFSLSVLIFYFLLFYKEILRIIREIKSEK